LNRSWIDEKNIAYIEAELIKRTLRRCLSWSDLFKRISYLLFAWRET